jgi:hypothetical protein
MADRDLVALAIADGRKAERGKAGKSRAGFEKPSSGVALHVVSFPNDCDIMKCIFLLWNEYPGADRGCQLAGMRDFSRAVSANS